MAPEDDNGGRPTGPVVLRVKLRYEDLDAMVQRFAPNIGKSGLFLPTKALQPVGTEVKFEMRLANDTPVLVGLGRVREARAHDPSNPGAAFGISIALMRVSRDSREVIIRMLERRRELGLPEVGVPLPDDIDVARDIVDRARESAPHATPAPVIEQAAPQAAPSAEVERPRSGPILAPIPQLPPERLRAARPRIEDLIGRAAERPSPLGTAIPELDEDVDVQRALARARALAGGDVDNELAALRESAAAPLGEISIEAASAELARQLGGKPIIKRDRAWAPPPPGSPAAAGYPLAPTATPVDPTPVVAPVEEFDARTRAETEAAPSAEIAAVIDAAVAAATGDAEQRAESPSIVPHEAYVIRKSDQFDSPYVEGENYRPQPSNYGLEEPTAVPLGDDPPPQPQAHPVITEEEDPDLAAFEAALEAARIHTGVTAAAPPAEDDEEEEDVAPAPLASPGFAGARSTPEGSAELIDEFSSEMRPLDPYQGAPAYPVLAEAEEEEIEELDDMDVVAIEDDDELEETPLLADTTLPLPPPDDDFASRLDLGDDHERPQRDSYDERGAGFGAPRYHGITFRPQEEEFDEPHRFPPSQPRIIGAPAEDLEQALSALDVDLDPSLRQQRRPRVSPAPRYREDSGPTRVRDQESSGPTRVRETTGPAPTRPLPGLPPRTGEVPTIKPKRAETDDGVMIDFDDDD